MAIFYPWSPSVGETFGADRLRRRHASAASAACRARCIAGLIIGLIQALSAFYLGPIYKDIVVYALFVALLWVRPQGLMGKASTR